MMIHGQDYAQGALITENEWITFQFQAIQGPTGGLIQFPPRIKCRTDDVLLEETGKIRLITETPLNQTLETNIIHQRRPRSFSSDQFQPCESTKSRERERDDLKEHESSNKLDSNTDYGRKKTNRFLICFGIADEFTQGFPRICVWERRLKRSLSTNKPNKWKRRKDKGGERRNRNTFRSGNE